MLESIKYFLCLLEIEPIWPVILLLALGMKAFFPWKLEGKYEETKDKDGNKVIKYYKSL